MTNDFLLSYDPAKRVFNHVAVLNGNLANGVWPIYQVHPLKAVEDVIARIRTQHFTIGEKNFTPGQSNQDQVFAEYRAKGMWLTPDEMREYLKAQNKDNA